MVERHFFFIEVRFKSTIFPLSLLWISCFPEKTWGGGADWLTDLVAGASHRSYSGGDCRPDLFSWFLSCCLLWNGTAPCPQSPFVYGLQENPHHSKYLLLNLQRTPLTPLYPAADCFGRL